MFIHEDVLNNCALESRLFYLLHFMLPRHTDFHLTVVREEALEGTY